MEGSAIDISEKLEGTYGRSKGGGGDDKKNYALVEKNNKKIFELLEFLEKDYEKIKGIFEEPDYENSEKFNNFLIALERQNDYDQTMLERNSRLDHIKAAIRDKQNYLQTLKKAAVNTVKVQEGYDITDEKVERQIAKDLKDTDKRAEAVIRQNSKIQQTLLASKVSTATICRKLGIVFRDDETFTELPFAEIRAKIEEKLNFVKERNPEAFEKLWKGEYDMEELYRHQLRGSLMMKQNEDAIQTYNTQDSMVSQE